MNIVSLSFFILVALSLLLYYCLPNNLRWYVLPAASLVFYAFSGLPNIVYIGCTTVSVYFIANKLTELDGLLKRIKKEKLSGFDSDKLKKEKKSLLVLGLIINLGLLLATKAVGYLVTERGLILPTNILGLLSPLGISFYTFIAVGYLADCYWGKVAAEKDFLRHTLFITYFPQIVQGPINRFKQLSPQLSAAHDFGAEKVLKGFIRFLWGLFKKLVIAERAVIFIDSVFSSLGTQPGSAILFSVFLYVFQLYADFSGGIDMVMGISEMFGISMDENFRQPLFSRSLSEFWSRWHITLGTWMKTYVFNPIAFSKPFARLGKKLKERFDVYIARSLPTGVALFITFLLVGLWHGVNLRYVAFGLLNGSIILFSTLMERRYEAWKSRLHINSDSAYWKAFRNVRTFVILVFAFYFLRVSNLGVFSLAFSRTVFCFETKGFASALLSNGLDVEDLLVLLVSVLLMLCYDLIDYRRGDSAVIDGLCRRKPLLRDAVIFVGIFLIIIFGCYGPSFHSAGFLYQMF